MHDAIACPAHAVKQQRWGQVAGNSSVVHRAGLTARVVVCSRARNEGFGAHGFQGTKCLMEKAKIELSTDSAAFYYYDQVERFK
jgi:hypothetical protein